MTICPVNYTAIAWCKSWHLLSEDMMHTICGRPIPYYADCRKWLPIMNTCITCAKRQYDAAFNPQLHKYYAPIAADDINPLFMALRERIGLDEVSCMHITVIIDTEDDASVRYMAGVCGSKTAALITKEGKIISLDNELENI